ncbi:MAG TPA: AMP-binding protein [Kofleriaceae bacterium]|nr:AMP-binding protein [Kofleriaceae bacterium]
MLKQTLDQLLVDACTRAPDRIFVHQLVGTGEQRTTYREALPRIAATCEALRAAGYEVGDRVVLHLEDQLDLLYFLLATAACGLIAVPIPPVFSTAMVHKAIARVAARGVFSSREHVASLAAAGIEPMCFLDEPHPGARALPTRGDRGFEDALALVRSEAATHTWSDPYIYLSTSGSTSEPKLVIRPHTSVTSLATFMAMGRQADDEPAQRVLMASGLNHGIGQANLALALFLGAAHLIPTRLEAEVLLDDVRRLDPTYVYCHPRVVNSLRQQQRAAGEPAGARLFGPGCHTVRFGGGPSTAELRRELADEGLDVGEIYAASETGSIAMTSRGNDRMRVLPDVVVRISDDQEIQVKTERGMIGYLQAVPRPPEAFTADGFYKTGDRGRLDPDGTLVFLARTRDLFNTQSGANINPVWIEGLLEVLPWVHQIVLVGDRRPDLGALIVLRDPEHAGDHGDGFLDPARHADVYARVQAELDAVNARLEPIERIARCALFASPFPDDAYARVSGSKTRRDRAKLGDRYAPRIEALYAVTSAAPETR